LLFVTFYIIHFQLYRKNRQWLIISILKDMCRIYWIVKTAVIENLLLSINIYKELNIVAFAENLCELMIYTAFAVNSDSMMIRYRRSIIRSITSILDSLARY
jgi:hypothetical protein